MARTAPLLLGIGGDSGTRKIWDHLLTPMKVVQDLAPDQLGSYAAGEASGHSDPLALVQLLVIYCLLQARETRHNAPQVGLAGMAER